MDINNYKMVEPDIFYVFVSQTEKDVTDHRYNF